MDTSSERQLLESVVTRAQKRLGLNIEIANLEPKPNCRRPDALIRIGKGHKTRTYAAEVKKGLRPNTLGAVLHQLEHGKNRPLLVVDYVTPPLAETLKERGVAFLDAAGNAYIDQPPLFVWVKGERPAEHTVTKQAAGRAFQATGLKVLFALLCHPEWAAHPYREIAQSAGVAHGTVGLVMAELTELGYVVEVAKRRRLVRVELLLKQWAGAYARTLRPKLTIGRYRTDLQKWWTKFRPNDYDVSLGGEPAAERVTQYLRPGTITLYCEEPKPRLLLDYRLRHDPTGPVELLKRFWKFETDDTGIAPLLLIYADLLFIGDARCVETADLIYDRIISGFVE